MTRCDHKFVDSRECLKCGVSVDELRRSTGSPEFGSAMAAHGLSLEPDGTVNVDPLDVRGPDGVSERWRRQFIPPEVRALADSVLANRYPKLDAAWRPVVQWAALSGELGGVTYGANWLQLHYQLGPLSSSLMLMLALEQVTQVRASDPPLWKARIEQTVLRLRLARAQLDVDVSSVEERDERARRRRAEQVEASEDEAERVEAMRDGFRRLEEQGDK